MPGRLSGQPRVHRGTPPCLSAPTEAAGRAGSAPTLPRVPTPCSELHFRRVASEEARVQSVRAPAGEPPVAQQEENACHCGIGSSGGRLHLRLVGAVLSQAVPEVALAGAGRG